MYYNGLLLGDNMSLTVYSILHKPILNFLRSPEVPYGVTDCLLRIACTEII
jgi:hypothetical protein